MLCSPALLNINVPKQAQCRRHNAAEVHVLNQQPAAKANRRNHAVERLGVLGPHRQRGLPDKQS
jgi:hypothetical protein